MRPQSITILSILLFVIGISLAVRSLGQFFMAPSFYTFLMLIISFIGLYCYYGLWNMKRWCIPLFFLVWGFILLPMLMGGDKLSMIMLMRLLYLISVMGVFLIVVLPHRNRLSSGLVWPLKKK